MTDMFAGVSTVTEETASTATVLRDKDIANAVIYTLGTPEGVEVSTNKYIEFNYTKRIQYKVFQTNYTNIRNCCVFFPGSRNHNYATKRNHRCSKRNEYQFRIINENFLVLSSLLLNIEPKETTFI